jgi:hypothetical protein
MLAEFLDAVDVFLLHPVLAVGIARTRAEGRDAPLLLVVPRHVGDEVADHREGLDRLDGDLALGGQRVHAGHARGAACR